ncbi:MAG: hypothetical protein FK733_15860, partial [Asgard group archaeon]|nr:hypothetical protein [Asgard group archaeon]
MNKRFRSRIILLMILGVLMIAVKSSDGTINDNGNLSVQLIPQLEEVAHIADTGGDTFQAIADGDILFVMDMLAGLKLYNISDPINPTLMDSYYDGGLAHDMHKVGDLLFMADHYDGLEIYNISNPFVITQLGTITDDGDGEMDGVYVKDELAYIAEWHDSSWDWSMKIINVTDPTSPVEITEYTDEDNEFARFFVRDNICYTACVESGFKILNVTNPNSIEEIASYNLAYSWEFQVIDDLAYVTDGSGIRILDISALETPTSLDFYNARRLCFGIEVIDDIAYIAEDEKGLRILNVSDPNNIFRIAQFDTEDVTNVEVQDDLIFLTMHEYGLLILKV